MHAGFAQPSFGQKMSSVNLMQPTSKQKPAGAMPVGAPKFGRAEVLKDELKDQFSVIAKEAAERALAGQIALTKKVAKKAAKKEMLLNRSPVTPMPFWPPYTPPVSPTPSKGLFSHIAESTQNLAQVAKEAAQLAGVGTGLYACYKIYRTGNEAMASFKGFSLTGYLRSWIPF